MLVFRWAAIVLATTAPVLATFENKANGVRFKYPADWQAEKAQTAVFAVAAPAGAAGSGGYSSLSLDIPKLPWHPFGILPIGSVESGYVKDLKKNQIHDAVEKESVDLKIPGAVARRVRCEGHEDGKPAIDVAVLIVHADRVYIFSCDSDNGGYAAARGALDGAIGTLEWMK